MEFVLLLLAAILIIKYVIKRSPAITICHIVFFVVLSYLSLFTTNFAPLAQLTQNIFGKEYFYVREAMSEPCIWIYSTNFAIYIVEFLLLLIVHLFAIVYVTKLIIKSSGKEYLRKTKPNFNFKVIPVRNFIKEEKIYLNNCSLLI